MSGQRYTPEFKDEAVRQVIEKGYSVGEVAQRNFRHSSSP
jgi:transposase